MSLFDSAGKTRKSLISAVELVDGKQRILSIGLERPKSEYPDNFPERVSAKVIVLGWNNETPSG
jgi:hypothetical protein